MQSLPAPDVLDLHSSFLIRTRLSLHGFEDTVNNQDWCLCRFITVKQEMEAMNGLILVSYDKE